MDKQNSVSRWFGHRFGELHPILQTLHREGGVIAGRVEVTTGKNLAGWLGKKVAKSIGLPTDQTHQTLTVEIKHTANTLEWKRQFGQGDVMISHFKPIGVLSNGGYWVENTGRLRLKLTVDVINGGWYWRPLKITFIGITIPLWLVPQSRAGKYIENQNYIFHVEFSLPYFGKILSYGGTLTKQIQ